MKYVFDFDEETYIKILNNCNLQEAKDEKLILELKRAGYTDIEITFKLEKLGKPISLTTLKRRYTKIYLKIIKYLQM